jgi:hypothetical protein
MGRGTQLSVTAFRPPVGTPLPTLVYVRLRGSKCVDGCRQGDIGTVLPTFGYVSLRHVDILFFFFFFFEERLS